MTIPVGGEVEITRRGSDYGTRYPVIALDEERGEFLIAVELGSKETGWSTRVVDASSLGRVTEYCPEPKVVPAAPGWWATTVSEEGTARTLVTQRWPVVAWQVPSGKYDIAEPLVLEHDGNGEGEMLVTTVSGMVTGSSEVRGGYEYDPDHRWKSDRLEWIRERLATKAASKAEKAKDGAGT